MTGQQEGGASWLVWFYSLKFVCFYFYRPGGDNMAWEFVESGYQGFTCLVDQNGDDILIPDGQNDGDFPICWMGEDMSDHVKRLIEVSPDLLAVCQRVERELCETIGNLRLDGYLSMASELETLRTDIHDVISQIPEVTDE